MEFGLSFVNGHTGSLRFRGTPTETLEKWMEQIVSKGRCSSWHRVRYNKYQAIALEWRFVSDERDDDLPPPPLTLLFEFDLTPHLNIWESRCLFAYVSALFFPDKNKYCIPSPKVWPGQTLRDAFERHYNQCMVCCCSPGEIRHYGGPLFKKFLTETFPIKQAPWGKPNWCANCMLIATENLLDPTAMEMPIDVICLFECVLRRDVLWYFLDENKRILFSFIQDRYAHVYVIVDLVHAQIFVYSEMTPGVDFLRDSNGCDDTLQRNIDRSKMDLVYARQIHWEFKHFLKNGSGPFTRKLHDVSLLNTRLLMITTILERHPLPYINGSPDINGTRVRIIVHSYVQEKFDRIRAKQKSSHHTCCCTIPNALESLKKRISDNLDCEKHHLMGVHKDTHN
jgi:hypothetical protein